MRSVSAESESGTGTPCVRDVDLDVHERQFVAIQGPPGCGKTTLLNVAGLLQRPCSGSYVLAGQEVVGLPDARLTELRNRHIGYIFQSLDLIEGLTVRENVELSLLRRGMPPAARKLRVDEAMERVGIAHRACDLPGRLSTGRRQLAAAARALAGRPKLILADDPTGRVDRDEEHDLMRLLQSINAEGTTILMATRSRVPADYAGRVLRMADGRLIQEPRRIA